MVKKFLAEKGLGLLGRSKEYRKLQDSLKGLEKKMDKVGKERKIRIEEQKKEYFDRTGKKLKIEESK